MVEPGLSFKDSAGARVSIARATARPAARESEAPANLDTPDFRFTRSASRLPEAVGVGPQGHHGAKAARTEAGDLQSATGGA